MKRILLVLMTFFLAACSLARPKLAPAAQALPPTETVRYQDCYFNWATKPLPEVSDKVQEAMEKAGLSEVRAFAEAYGENCFDSRTNEVAYFATMETDFRFSAAVPDLADTKALGTLLERMLVVLDQFPPDTFPGPNLGTVGIRFTSQGQELNVWFHVDDGKTAREQGLHGAELLDRLQVKTSPR